MNHDGSKIGAFAAILALPLLVVCCVAPALLIGLASSTVSWFSGFGAFEAVVIFGVVVAAVFGLKLISPAQSHSSKTKIQ